MGDLFAARALNSLAALGVPQNDVLDDLYRYCRPMNQEWLAAIRESCAESADSAANIERKKFYKRGASAKGDGRDEFWLARLHNRMMEASNGQYPSPWSDLAYLVTAGNAAFNPDAPTILKDALEKRVKRFLKRFPDRQHPHYEVPQQWRGQVPQDLFAF
jgi:hypothetical protein